MRVEIADGKLILNFLYLAGFVSAIETVLSNLGLSNSTGSIDVTSRDLSTYAHIFCSCPSSAHVSPNWFISSHKQYARSRENPSGCVLIWSRSCSSISLSCVLLSHMLDSVFLSSSCLLISCSKFFLNPA